MPGLVATTVATSSSRFFTGLPLNSRMMSPGSMPALAAGWPLRDRADQRAAAFLQAELGERVGRNRRHADADDAARDTCRCCSCGISSRTLLIGIAKPMPMLPCWRESV